MAELGQNLNPSQANPSVPPAPNTLAPAGTPPPPKEGAPRAPPADPKVAVDPNAAAAADPKVSSKLQVLIQREKAAIVQERNAKTREEKVIAREKTLEAREAKITEFESIKATNPRRALELLGMSYQDLTMAELNDGVPAPDLQLKTLEGKLDTFKKELDDREKAAAEREQANAAAAETQAVSDFKSQIGLYIDANPEQCEFIKFEGKRDLVFEVIDKHYERTIDAQTGVGKVLTIAEAAAKVEKFLEFKYEKALELKKLSGRVVPRQHAPKPSNVPPGQKPKTDTLTNSMSGSSGAPRAKILSDDERVQKAIAYAHNLRKG